MTALCKAINLHGPGGRIEITAKDKNGKALRPAEGSQLAARRGLGLIGHHGERDCAGGSLGVIPAQDLMPLVMANALRLTKYGA